MSQWQQRRIFQKGELTTGLWRMSRPEKESSPDADSEATGSEVTFPGHMTRVSGEVGLGTQVIGLTATASDWLSASLAPRRTHSAPPRLALSTDGVAPGLRRRGSEPSRYAHDIYKVRRVGVGEPVPPHAGSPNILHKRISSDQIEQLHRRFKQLSGDQPTIRKENFNNVPDLELNPIRSKIIRAFFDNSRTGGLASVGPSGLASVGPSGLASVGPSGLASVGPSGLASMGPSGLLSKMG
ncbi:uncharacterized protein LOC115936854, partial [Leptonychotes weddellii]|uniref:Uncharacterized protein LOC115936854 n=1 Tax=Leptonychotes weddellii TaxID=9713 RepID=A0A7F8PX16_LEPWE